MGKKFKKNLEFKNNDANIKAFAKKMKIHQVLLKEEFALHKRL
jgi:hypothetical protein